MTVTHAESCRRYRAALRQRALSVIGDSCVVCYTKLRIECAHIKPTKIKGMGRGMERRYLDVIKHPLYYVPLCHYHHVRFDACEFELVLNLFIWGRHVIIYDPPRRPSNRRKGRRSNPDSKAIKCTGDCPF